jgi:hypothetical protein
VARSDEETVVQQSIPFCSFSSHELIEIQPSKDFDPIRTTDFRNLLIGKCQSCSIKTDMCNKCERNRNTQQFLLTQLITVFDRVNLMRKLDPKCLESMFGLITAIISREFPRIKVLPATFLCDRSEVFCDTAWPIVSLAYKLLSCIICCSHVSSNLISPHLSPQFLSLLFRCLSSPDDRERHQIKLILFAVSGRLQDRAPLICGFIAKSFIDSIFDEPIRFGLGQLFELFGNLIQSIPVFANNSFDLILRQQLFPLHLSSEYLIYAPQLIACILILLVRNPRNVDDLILFLLHHFPCASQKKQLLFLEEITSIVERCWEALAPRTTRILFERLSRLYSSTCAEISERSLELISSPAFGQLLKQYYITLAPLLIDRALVVSKNHWNSGSRSMSFALLQKLSRLDQLNFAKIQSEAKSTSEADDDQQKALAWQEIANGICGPARSSTSRTEPLKPVLHVHRGPPSVSGRPSVKLPVLTMNRLRIRI